MNATLTKIAAELLQVDTLETQDIGSADFHELAVWNIKAALEAAFEAGRRAAAQEG